MNIELIRTRIPDTYQELKDLVGEEARLASTALSELERLWNKPVSFNSFKAYRSRELPRYLKDSTTRTVLTAYAKILDKHLYVYVTDAQEIKNAEKHFERQEPTEEKYRLMIIRYPISLKATMPKDTEEVSQEEKALGQLSTQIMGTKVLVRIEEETLTVRYHVLSHIEDYENMLLKTLPAIVRETIYDQALYTLVEKCTLHPDNLKEYLLEYLDNTHVEEEQVQNILKKDIRNKIDRCKQDLNRTQQDFDSILASLNIRAQVLKDTKLRLQSLKQQLNERIDTSRYDEIKDYLKQCYTACADLVPNEYKDASLRVVGSTTLSQFDEEAATALINNIKTMYGQELPFRHWTDTNIELFYAIFIKKQYQIAISYAYLIDLRNFMPSRERNFIVQEGTIGHPHTMAFSCWGSHLNEIQKYKAMDDLLGAVSQCQYAMEQINLLDSAVLRNALKSVANTEQKCLIDLETKEAFNYRDISVKVHEMYMKDFNIGESDDILNAEKED